MKKIELLFLALRLPVDAFMITIAVLAAYYYRGTINVPSLYGLAPINDYLNLVFYFIPLCLLIFALTGSYDSRHKKTSLAELLSIIIAVSAYVSIMIIELFLTKTDFFSRLVILFNWAFTIVLVFAGRTLLGLIQRILYYYNYGTRRVAIIGRDEFSSSIASNLGEDKGLGYRVVAKLNPGDHLIIELDKTKCDDIIIAQSNLSSEQIQEIASYARLNRKTLKIIPDQFLLLFSHMRLTQVVDFPALELRRTPLDGWGRIFKRIIDLVLSSIGIVIASPIMLVVALMVKFTSKGPILYRQERVGLDANFMFYKFRSMKLEDCVGEDYGGEAAEKKWEDLNKNSNEADGPVFKIKNDPRITSVGRFIRKTSLDELPQLFNVLKGDMSLVGPRPPLESEVKQYNDWQKQRLGVKPGMTGLWQVSGRSSISFDEWVRLDAYYIENWSIWLDLKIIVRTFLVVIFRRGAY
ncbi:MAG: sugar transferase [Patescibacteria group bacterium]|jgi:exopolysaccharide biosynthesis polyprenyl glycosylphosphotransferase